MCCMSSAGSSGCIASALSISLALRVTAAAVAEMSDDSKSSLLSCFIFTMKIEVIFCCYVVSDG